MTESIQTLFHGDSAVKIVRSIEISVANGRLTPGDPLPPIRNLARDLGVSPTTVAAAYAKLRERGLVETRGRAGTRIAKHGPVARAVPSPVPPGLVDLSSGNPDPSLLPNLTPALRKLDPGPRLYGIPRHHPDLVALASAAYAQDGIAADHVLVASGAIDGIQRVLRTHLGPGQSVAVEDPGFPGVLDVVAGLMLRRLAVAVDDEGPTPEGLSRALAQGARAFVFSPRAQNPTGAALSARRVRQLTEVLREYPHCVVVEDDHVGDVAGASARTLTKRHRGPWAVVRSTSKTLGPDLRVATVAADAETATGIDAQLRVSMLWVSHLLQEMVCDLLGRQSVAQRLVRAGQKYERRREALLAALTDHGISARGASGLNVWVPVPRERPVVDGLAQRGWAVLGGEPFRTASEPAIRVTISNLMPRDARRLAQALREVLNAGDTAVLA